ncbi:transcriptional regulator [Methanobrevibacter sp. DSM 116169]|uniref:transcriptional regulator n=1 Tax=Methanobrevibacter sp. DSM 116169 TaxID=3242727 RepID=UPI0038FCCBE5
MTSKDYVVSEDLLRLVAYIQTSTYRLKVLKSMDGNFITPTAIGKATDLRTNHVSSVLSELKEKNLVECINDDVRKGRIYKTTDLGKDVINCINQGIIK